MSRIIRPILILAAIAAVLGLFAVGRKSAGHHAKSTGGIAQLKGKQQASVIGLVPPGVKTALWLDVRRLHEAPALAALREKFWDDEKTKGAAQFKSLTEIDLRHDLDELVVCGDVTNPGSLLLIGRGSFDTAALNKAFRQFEAVELLDYKGTPVFQFIAPKNHFECIAVLGQRELAAGGLNAVKELLDYREGKKAGHAAASPMQDKLTALGEDAAARIASVQVADLPKVKEGPFKEHTKLFALAAVISNDTEATLRGRFELDQPELAKQATEFLTAAVKNVQATLEDQPQKVKGFDQFAASFKVAQEGSAVTATAQVPSALMESLMQLKGQRPVAQVRRAARGPDGAKAPSADQPREANGVVEQFVARINSGDAEGIRALIGQPFYLDGNKVEDDDAMSRLIEKLTDPARQSITLKEAKAIGIHDPGVPAEADQVLTADDKLLAVELRVGDKSEQRIVVLRNDGNGYKLLAIVKPAGQ